MAKRVFFSFHYQDVVDFRANVVRNHWMAKPDRDESGYFDASLWEEAKKKGDIALKRLINGGLDRTTVTCVLVGTDTYERPWVRYEICKSIVRGNKLFAVHINSIKGKNQATKTLGENPFSWIAVEFSDDASKYALNYRKSDGKYYYYEEIESTRWFNNDVFSKNFPGKNKLLSDFYPIYNWTSDDGFNKFSSWVD